MKKYIFLDEKKWCKSEINGIKILYKGFDFKKTYTSISKALASKNSIEKLSTYIKSLDGNFAIILIKDKSIYAITDKVRSFPLSYYFDGKKFFIFENYQSIKKLSFNKTLSKEQLLFFSLSGYTFNDGTLFKKIKQVNQGTIIRFYKNKIKKINYYSSIKKIKNKSVCLEKELKDTNEKIILKLIKSCKNKCIVIPLSAGYDSRFILSGLKEYGFNNIITFSYGRLNNREAKIAEVLSKKLKVPWHYIPYTNKKLKKIMDSEEHASYKEFTDNLTSIHFPQDFMAIKYLNN